MRKTNRILIVLLFAGVIAGLVCNYFYEISPKHTFQIAKFQKQLAIKEGQAAKTLEDLKLIITRSSKRLACELSFCR